MTAIASYIDGPQIVVAVASDADARAALRRGVDDAERARYTVTIREAEAFLLQVFFRDCSLLVLFRFILLGRCSWDSSPATPPEGYSNGAVGGDLCYISLAVLEGRAHERSCPSAAYGVVVYSQWLTLRLFDFLRFAVVASFLPDAR